MQNLKVEYEKRVLSEKKYRTLFNSMFDGFALHEIICDQNGKQWVKLVSGNALSPISF